MNGNPAYHAVGTAAAWLRHNITEFRLAVALVDIGSSCLVTGLVMLGSSAVRR
ncbi:hypothetical protein OG898_10380 [Streptomyces sp. NBC_00193]|uniref:hypothetical protein n=1 Tax=Streptomyces sp. NBC_00193 TaxID=2975675 RepID=UPI00225B4916|nr:hypothetical protein [Streptomyces sp. NBC_00193]MCX5296895.1 hypothetical protein [Streptomyces sp. NBC_00193]